MTTIEQQQQRRQQLATNVKGNFPLQRKKFPNQSRECESFNYEFVLERNSTIKNISTPSRGARSGKINGFQFEIYEVPSRAKAVEQRKVKYIKLSINFHHLMFALLLMMFWCKGISPPSLPSAASNTTFFASPTHSIHIL